MECNKDEALRAKEIAEKRFLANDILGAKKLALKSFGLYPLDEVQKMIATFDVYLNAEGKINHETDWYRVLGVKPQADDEEVRQQFRHMALLLHPDKNKSVGAEGAFKHVSEAWNVLSDKAKRAAYDQRRKARSLHASSSSGPSSSNRGTNGFYNSTKSSAKASRGKTAQQCYSTSSSHKPKSNTFWTVCHRCKMQYEYLRVYLNHNLLCPNCHEAFLAIEVPPPGKSSTRCSFDFYQHPDDRAGKRGATASGRDSNGFADNSNSYANWAFSGRGSAVHASSVVQQAYEKVRREREEAQAASRREERRKNAKRTVSGSGPGTAAKRRKGMEEFVVFSSHGSSNAYQMGGRGNTASLHATKDKSVGTVVNGIVSRPSTSNDASWFDMHSALRNKARNEVSKKVQEINSISIARAANKAERTEDQKVVESSVSNETLDQNKSDDSSGEVERACAPLIKRLLKTFKLLEFAVLQPDFHVFDKDRTETSFGENQIWAVYDGNDGMPRLYVLIRDVISLKPFQVNISWLSLRSNGNWGFSGFSKTCGDFGVGRHRMIYTSLDSFSHKVHISRVSDDIIRIYPKREDVWALYRNWSPDWNELTAYEVIDKYDLVEVLEDYSDESGVAVIPLIKVARFKTVFHRHLDMGEIRRIPREEIDRFSHLIPSRLLTSQGVPHPLKGCIELDPAATPSQFLRVIHDVDEVELVNEEKVMVNDEAFHVETSSDNELIKKKLDNREDGGGVEAVDRKAVETSRDGKSDCAREEPS